MSRVIKYVCDCCGKEIPVIKKTDVFGIEREYLQSGKVESIRSSNLSMFGVDLCKDCSHKIDMEIMESKLKILKSVLGDNHVQSRMDRH